VEYRGWRKSAGVEKMTNGVPELPDVESAGDLSALDDDRLRARLSTLPIRQQVDAVLSLEWADRLRVIKNAPAPKKLVGEIPDEEILLTIKGMGEEDTLDLISLTSPTQLQFLLDVELWSGDTLDKDKVKLWLEYLIGCGEDKVVEFVETADRDLLVLLLVRLLYLIPNEEEGSAPTGTANIMPDEYFTILSRLPEGTENVKLLLRVMRQWDRDAFYGLLFEAYGSAGPEEEEKALRWRNSRLEEKGLLEFDEAIEIYGYIGEDEARCIAEVREPAPPVSGPTEAPSYALRLAGTGTLLSRILASIADRELRNRLRSEIAFTANRLLVADAGNIGDLDSMQRALDRLFSHANLGLQFLCGGDVGQAGEILKHTPIKGLFQIGFSRAVDLKSRAMAIARKWWPAWRQQGFTFLGFPEDGIMKGLLLRVPQYYALGWAGDVEARDFQSMDEVARTGEVLDEILAAADLCFGVLGIPAPSDADLETADAFVADLEEIDLRRLLATGFVHFSLGGAFEIEPLMIGRVKALFEGGPEEAGDHTRRLKPGSVDGFLDWLRERAGGQSLEWQALQRFARKAFAGLEDEFKGIASWPDLDPRYVRSVILKRERGRESRG